MAQFSFIRPGESPELGEDIRELFEDIATHLRPDQFAFSGECHPAMDVYETDVAVEIVMDASAVQPRALRVLFRRDVLLIAGEKTPAAGRPDQEFHLVEREFGRFARAVRVTGAFDAPAVTAVLRDGELTVVLPKRPERRGHPHRILVSGPA